MKRFILPNTPDHTGMIRLSGKDYHYLARVRRFKAGTIFEAFLPDGEEILVQVRSTKDDCLVGVCVPFREKESADPGALSSTAIFLPPILLFQALPKASKMDLIVRQAAEGGITEIVPFVSEYSVPKIEAGSQAEKLERWFRIVKEARQQSGSRIDTGIRAPCTLEGLINYWKILKSRYSRTAGILLHQASPKGGGFHSCLTKSPDLVALAIGPEGGFSPGDVAQFLSAGFKPLMLGTTILRTETAALYAAAAVRIILLESESWTSKIPE